FHYIEHVHGADANGRRIDKQFQPTLTAWYVQGKDWIDSIRDAHPQIAIMLGSSAVEAGIAYCPIRQ
ncbi:MAG: hypothetical protein JO152_01710, partial [Mycobacteriaceae bacterium]|nr:hypothetical protein [Mycobacteriaceae bacterium]